MTFCKFKSPCRPIELELLPLGLSLVSEVAEELFVLLNFTFLTLRFFDFERLEEFLFGRVGRLGGFFRGFML